METFHIVSECKTDVYFKRCSLTWDYFVPLSLNMKKNQIELEKNTKEVSEFVKNEMYLIFSI